MVQGTKEEPSERNSRYAHLSDAHPEWENIAPSHAAVQALMDRVYDLPLAEFRKIPYKPAPLPEDSPVPGKDLIITEDEVVVRDGHKVGIRIYKPLQLIRGQALFYNVHGGGWTVGNPETEEAQNRLIAAKNKIMVVSADYRKAPEFPFPYALNDALDVLLWCKGNAEDLGIDPEKLIVGGGSAGANISTVVTHIARDEGISGIIGQVLNIPVTCHPAHFPSSMYEYQSYDQNANAPIINAKKMRWFWNNYLPNAEADPRASPLLATTLAALPPALIQVAGMDALRDEGLAYADALKASGVDVTLKIYPGLPHAFYAYPNIEPSKEYFQTVVDWIHRIIQNSDTHSNEAK